MAARGRDRRQRAERRGRLAEWLAALMLLCRGYRILAMRHRTPLGEIDLIARKGDLAVFVEVKARAGEREALDAVGAAAARRIRAASEIWLSHQPDAARLSSRYDIVAVRPLAWPTHYPDAF
ncbi:YraN family protein [Gellertiella hungarica]|uniref:UPF0102 protein GGR23_000921 n=1 Tax=Gellertiella hungarica TaxID=1572859 RepID=A0A7W6NJQ7_9HYPH|nr:YraN family protein [Gellertiella hungarica]MBB4063744.1 putative endonuclease [Gellertiella hungarica]